MHCPSQCTYRPDIPGAPTGLSRYANHRKISTFVKYISALIFLGIFTTKSRIALPGSFGTYFSELLTALKRPLRELPTPETAAMMVRLMPAAISAYSIAVAPD